MGLIVPTSSRDPPRLRQEGDGEDGQRTARHAVRGQARQVLQVKTCWRRNAAWRDSVRLYAAAAWLWRLGAPRWP